MSKKQIELIVWACKCDKCGYQWQTKNELLPRICSKCKSVKWNSNEQTAINKPLINEKSDEKPEVMVNEDKIILRQGKIMQFDNIETIDEPIIETDYDFGS